MSATVPYGEKCAQIFRDVLREVFQPRDPTPEPVTARRYCPQCAQHFAAALRRIMPATEPAKPRQKKRPPKN